MFKFYVNCLSLHIPLGQFHPTGIGHYFHGSSSLCVTSFVGLIHIILLQWSDSGYPSFSEAAHTVPHTKVIP